MAALVSHGAASIEESSPGSAWGRPRGETVSALAEARRVFKYYLNYLKLLKLFPISFFRALHPRRAPQRSSHIT